MTEISDWLMNKFLEWEKETGERQTFKAFADYLGVKPTTFSSWMNSGIPPTGDNIRKVADKLGYEIYDILDIPQDERPVRADLREAIRQIPPGNQDDLLELIEEFLRDHGWHDR